MGHPLSFHGMKIDTTDEVLKTLIQKMQDGYVMTPAERDQYGSVLSTIDRAAEEVRIKGKVPELVRIYHVYRRPGERTIRVLPRLDGDTPTAYVQQAKNASAWYTCALGVRDVGIPDRTPGQVAYEAFAESLGWKTLDGRMIPSWTVLSDKAHRAWEAAARAVQDIKP